MENQIFTKDELRQYNGKNGTPVYIAHKGKVYDVTDSFLWENGEHQDSHSAGMDLTSEIDDAPHDELVLEIYPQVGVLAEE